MSGGGQLIFMVGAIVAIVTAILTVSMRSPLRAAVALLAHIFSLAGLYLTLHAHLLAAIQLLVYAGAVVVLFIFVIMLIGPSAEEDDEKKSDAGRGFVVRIVATMVMAMICAGLAFGVASVDRPYVDIDQCADGSAECGQYGGVQALSDAIFSRDGAAIPFELLGILLLVAILAAVAVARGHNPEEKAAFEEGQEPEGRADAR